MADYNKVILIGRLTRNPELRYTPSKTAVVDIGVAVDDSYTNQKGERVERTCFVDVVVWGRQAETVSEYLRKGSPVFVEGTLQLDQWETPEGEKRSKLRVRAQRVQFLGAPARSAELAEPAAPASPPPASPASPPPPSAAEEGGDDEDIPF